MNQINVVIPMAGRGDRMKQAGYTDSKPLIDVLGKPMIQRVIENINLPNAKYWFIVQHEDYKKYGLETLLSGMVADCNVYQLNKVTQGAAESVLYLHSYIGTESPLLIVNSDQVIQWKEDNPYEELGDVDGCIWCFKADNDPKFSYARTEGESVVEVAEKKVISDNATAGAYYWKHGKDFVSAAFNMIEKDIRTNNEFYVAPVYNELLDKNIIIKAVDGVDHLGTPEELRDYIKRNSQ